MFNPDFTRTTDIKSAADYINAPHEDYPQRVEQTEWAIAYIVQHINNGHPITESTIRAVHAIIMWDLDSSGAYRTCNVRIGDDIPPPFYDVPQLMHELMPVNVTTIENIRTWYVRFERIHPFEDGNGRVGGTILAAVSKMIDDHFHIAI